VPKPPQIRPLGHDLSLWIRFLVHSEPGVGKTVLAGTTKSRSLILLADPNVQSAVLYGSTADKWEMNNWTDMENALMYLAHEGYRDYDWVWLDSETHFQERGLDGIMEELIVGNPSRGQAGKPHRVKWGTDKGDIGQNMSRLAMWHRDMIRIPINIGVTAHTMRDEIELDDGTIENLWVPAIQGRGMPAKICSYMNLVGFMYARRVEGGQIETGLITQKDSSHYAKDNWMGATGGLMINPTIPKIEAAIAIKKAQLARKTGAAAPAKAGAAKAVASTKTAVAPAKAAAKKAVAATKKTTR
jgi:hypothetical protein